MSRLFNRLALFLWLDCLALVSLTASSCQETSPVNVESFTEKPSPGEVPFVEHRSWTQPRPIEVIPEVAQRIPPYPTALSTSGSGQLHLVTSIPADTLLPHERFYLGYFFYDGARWIHRTDIQGYGLFIPATVLGTTSATAHLFWTGITPDLQQDWLDHKVFTSHLYYCYWNGEECSSPTIISDTVPSISHPAIILGRPMADQSGQIHLVADVGYNTFHFVFSPEGQFLNKTRIGSISQPHILMQADTLHLVYMDASRVRGVANDLYYQAYRNGAWSEPVVLFHDVDALGHHPSLAIDSKGVYHLAFYSQDRHNGYITTMYTYSMNQGRSWSDPDPVYVHRSLFFRAPQLAVDSHDILHLIWSHGGGLLSDSLSFGIDNFYASRQNGSWSKAQRLYPELEPKSNVYMVIDANDVVHLVFAALDKNIYHVTFE